MINSSYFETVLSAGVPESARQLIWNIFFASRRRGISLSVHFPWLDSNPNVFCLAIRAPQSTQAEGFIAALVIRRDQTESGQNIGLIGLVCVAEEWRGKGLSSILMSDAINFANQIDLDALVLWTQKPEVYTGHGFAPDGQDMYGFVERTLSHRSCIEFTTEAWPDLESIQAQRGLPPFAVSGRSISTNSAKVIVLESYNGVTLAEWYGSNAAIVDLLESALPTRWGLTICEGSGLVTELLKRNFKVGLKPAALRLVKNLKAASVLITPEINLLDRI